MSKCVVIGSINIDMVAFVDRFPQPGETRTGTLFQQLPGGKGANQAVALGRLSADVTMAGCVGTDMLGDMYLDNFRKNAVDASAVIRVDNIATGTAVIEVDDTGENHIVIIPGANGKCDVQWADRVLDKLKGDIYLLQLEIPHETVFAAIRRIKEKGGMVILDPAPAAPIPADILALCDIITPNETELAILTSNMDADCDMNTRMQALREMGAGVVITKCGADGACVLDADGFAHITGFKVTSVDTTAAGDTFNAALAWALSENIPLHSAIVKANAAAALSVTAAGAQGGMPDRNAVEEFLKENRA